MSDKMLRFGFMVGLVGGCLAACDFNDPQPQDLLNEVIAANKLVVSTDEDYPPQSFQNPDGEMEGFDIDVAREIAERLGVDVEFSVQPWDKVVAGNWNGAWDISIGSMTPTEERAKQFWFIDPYYYTPASFCIYLDNTTFTAPSDLEGTTVGVAVETTNQYYLEGRLNILGGEVAYAPPANIYVRTYATEGATIEAVAAGDGVNIDAGMSAQPTIQNAIDNGLRIKFLGDPAFYEPLVFALDKNRVRSDLMITRINQIVEDLHEDGTLSALSIKWYGIDITTPVSSLAK